MRWSPRNIDVNFELARSVYAADLDNDGDNDVLGASYGLDEIAWWENDGNGHFSTKQSISNTFYGAQCVRAADLDGDGDIDVLGIAFSAGTIAWWQNDGGSPPNFNQYLIADGFSGGIYVEAIDLDNDNDIDVIATGANDQSPIWWENNGSGNFTEHAIQQSGGMLHFSVGDLNGDGDIDIVATSWTIRVVSWFENDGACPPNFIEHFLSTVEGVDPYPNYVTDLDSDGDADIVLGYGQKLVWMERRSDIISQDGLIFDLHTICYQMQLAATSIYVTDLDDNQNKDILVTAASCYKDGRDNGGSRSHEKNITWWKNDGDEHFTEYVIALDYWGVGSGYATHIDNDCYEDVLAVSNILGRITWWKNSPIVVYKPIHRSSAEEESDNTHNVVLTSAPINSRGKVNFSLTLNKATYVDLSMYDALGKKVETLVSQTFTPGTYHISNNENLPAGIYFYSFQSPLMNEVGKFVLIQ